MIFYFNFKGNFYFFCCFQICYCLKSQNRLVFANFFNTSFLKNRTSRAFCSKYEPSLGSDPSLGVRDIIAVGIDLAPSLGAHRKARFGLAEPQLQTNRFIKFLILDVLFLVSIEKSSLIMDFEKLSK